MQESLTKLKQENRTLYKEIEKYKEKINLMNFSNSIISKKILDYSNLSEKVLNEIFQLEQQISKGKSSLSTNCHSICLESLNSSLSSWVSSRHKRRASIAKKTKRGYSFDLAKSQLT